MTEGVIAANFAEVEAGAQSILSSGRSIASMLEEFHTQVKGFVDANPAAATEAFNALQAQWNQKTQELTTVLSSAASAVIEGNANLNDTDKKNAAMFGGG